MPLYRIVVPGLCLLLIFLRAVFPELRFDEVSLWLFGIGTVVLAIPDLGDLISRLKRLKRGDLELEFNAKVGQLEAQTGAVEEQVEVPTVAMAADQLQPDSALAVISGAGGNPRLALIELSLQIESALRDLAREAELSERPLSPTRTLRSLVEQRLVDPRVEALFRDFWAVRNSAVHSLDFMVDDRALVAILDVGVRILRLLGAGVWSRPHAGA